MNVYFRRVVINIVCLILFHDFVVVTLFFNVELIQVSYCGIASILVFCV